MTVKVVVQEAGAGAPFGGSPGHACRSGHVLEPSVSGVPVEDVGAERRDVEIEPAVAVVVADGNTCLVPARAGGCSAGRLRDVGERPVTVVPVQRIRGARGSVHEVQVRQPVIVDVDPGHAGAKRLDHVLVGCGAGGVQESDAGCRGDVLEDRGGRFAGSSAEQRGDSRCGQQPREAAGRWT